MDYRTEITGICAKDLDEATSSLSDIQVTIIYVFKLFGIIFYVLSLNLWSIL